MWVKAEEFSQQLLITRPPASVNDKAKPFALLIKSDVLVVSYSSYCFLDFWSIRSIVDDQKCADLGLNLKLCPPPSWGWRIWFLHFSLVGNSIYLVKHNTVTAWAGVLTVANIKCILLYLSTGVQQVKQAQRDQTLGLDDRHRHSLPLSDCRLVCERNFNIKSVSAQYLIAACEC